MADVHSKEIKSYPDWLSGDLRQPVDLLQTGLHGNRHNRFITFEGKFPGVDFKKLVVKTLLFRNRNNKISFFGLQKRGDTF